MNKLDNKIDRVLESWQVPQNRSKSDVWAAIQNKTVPREAKFVMSFAKMGIAASIMLALGISVYFIGEKTVYVPSGNALHYALPDGSTVDLQPNSSLSYNDFTFYFNRVLHLEGEGYFKVKKGTTFAVETTPDKVVRVLGTTFQVYDRPDFYKVVCTEGRVSVHSDSHDYILNPLNGVTVANGKAESFSIEPDIAAHLADRSLGIYTYKNDKLSSVLDDLKNVYGVSIQYQASSERVYTGYFDNTSLEKSLTLICEPLGLAFYQKDGEIIIK